MMERDDEAAQLRYAQALADWGDAGGYDAEMLWDTCTVAALGMPYERRSSGGAHPVRAASRSGSSWRRCCAAPTRCCCSTSRTTTSTSRASAGSRTGCTSRRRPCCFVSHDRELLARVGDRIVTVERAPRGRRWVHGGGFATYHEAARERTTGSRSCAGAGTRSTPSSRSWSLHVPAEGRVQRGHGVAGYQAAQYPAAAKFEEAGPARGACRASRTSRCGCAAAAPACGPSTCEHLELTGLMKPFDLEVFFGERVAVLGSNGSGKSHFLRLLAAGGRTPIASTSRSATSSRPGRAHRLARLGARVRPGIFAQTHEHPELLGRTLLEILTAATSTSRHARGGGAGAAPLRAGARGASRPSRRCRAASRRGSRSCCSSSRARRCCCSTSRPTTSTCDSRRGAGGGPRRVRGDRASR